MAAATVTLVLVLVSLMATAVPSAADAARRCFGERATIARGGGNDVIRGAKGHDVIHAGGGRDRIFGVGGNDRLCGGPGDDVIVGGRGSDRLAGNGGADRVSGGRGGFDIVVGNVGRDRIDGGRGPHDVASFVTTTAPLRIDLTAGVIGGGELERPRGFEDALGGSGADTLIGDARANRLDGGPGDDAVHAVGFLDAAFGGPGSDACVGPFAAYDSCGEPAQAGRAVIVERVRSIDTSASLVITGTAAGDDISLRRARGRYLARSSGVALAPGVAQACAFAGSRLIACPGGVARVQVAMGAGNDDLTARDVPPGVNVVIDGGAGSDRLTGGTGEDTIYGGDDRAPDRLAGAAGDDQLFGVNTEHPRKRSGRAVMLGGPGSDLMIGGQPCEGDRFVGGPGRNDSASFARIRNPGVNVRGAIGGAVRDPDAGRCDNGRISRGTEKIEGSPGRDILLGDDSPNVLLGRGGHDRLIGRGGHDRCIGGGANDKIRCERRFR